ncbi:MAG: sugar transferase [Clostridiaceae bacterium]|nr:sugar transferase [Clostridiaceae bacterium]MDD7614250.1 sugar transferase [Clostridiaceae bacterium]MDY5888846.1 sugar transferase [Oscillospiraceae bacterium]
MKRVFDFIISLFALIILSPLFLLISLIILIGDGKPVLFRQKRVGKNNELFTIYKFRTMKRGTENVASGKLENANAKITKFGRILRATSIDELPQLFNILNGTMSLVGPRPLIPEETEIRELREKYNVYTIRPGITGWAQVNGRDNISLEQKALLDKEYVEKQSLGFDIKILVMTVLKVLRREDVNEGNNRA